MLLFAFGGVSISPAVDPFDTVGAYGWAAVIIICFFPLRFLFERYRNRRELRGEGAARKGRHFRPTMTGPISVKEARSYCDGVPAILSQSRLLVISHPSDHELDHLLLGVAIELAVEALHVGAHGILRHVLHLGDALHGIAHREVLEDGGLSLRELVGLGQQHAGTAALRSLVIVRGGGIPEPGLRFGVGRRREADDDEGAGKERNLDADHEGARPNGRHRLTGQDVVEHVCQDAGDAANCYEERSYELRKAAMLSLGYLDKQHPVKRPYKEPADDQDVYACDEKGFAVGNGQEHASYNEQQRGTPDCHAQLRPLRGRPG